MPLQESRRIPSNVDGNTEYATTQATISFASAVGVLSANACREYCLFFRLREIDLREMQTGTDRVELVFTKRDGRIFPRESFDAEACISKRPSSGVLMAIILSIPDPVGLHQRYSSSSHQWY